jgi:transposase-like protein
MKNPVYEQIQARKVKARLRMLQHAQRISGNVSQTCRFFGVSRALYYIWKERYEKHGVAGLRDLPRRPHKIRFQIPPEIVSLILRIREERRYGAVRVSLYLQRHYHAYQGEYFIFCRHCPSVTTFLQAIYIVMQRTVITKSCICAHKCHYVPVTKDA